MMVAGLDHWLAVEKAMYVADMRAEMLDDLWDVLMANFSVAQLDAHLADYSVEPWGYGWEIYSAWILVGVMVSKMEYEKASGMEYSVVASRADLWE